MQGPADRFIYLMGRPARPDANHWVRWNMLSRMTLDQLQMLITVAAMALLPQRLRELVVGSVSTDAHADGSPEFDRTVDRLLA